MDFERNIVDQKGVGYFWTARYLAKKNIHGFVLFQVTAYQLHCHSGGADAAKF